MPAEFSERRTPVRFVVTFLLDCVSLDGAQISGVATHDISSHGFGLISKGQISPSTRLRCFLVVPDNGEVVCVEGEVIWSSECADGRYRSGMRLFDSHFKPIPLVLRAVNSRL